MTTRRTIIGSICGFLALPFLCEAKPEPRLLPGRLATIKAMPLRAMVSMPLEEYDQLKKELGKFEDLKKGFLEHRKRLENVPQDKDCVLMVFVHPDGTPFFPTKHEIPNI